MVAPQDWTRLLRGLKSEFRQPASEFLLGGHGEVVTPTPVLAYCEKGRSGAIEGRMMVLQRVWTEPIGAITPESIEREGFDSIDSFRTAWMIRTGHRFRVLEPVLCYRVAPWDAQAEEEAGRMLFEQLYGGLPK